jgi:hypothetical protein
MTAPASYLGFESPVVATIPAPLLRGESRPTDREYAILAAVVQHAGYRGAAEALDVSIYRVREVLEHLREWHGASTTTHLAALVMRDVGDIFGAEWRAA